MTGAGKGYRIAGLLPTETPPARKETSAPRRREAGGGEAQPSLQSPEDVYQRVKYGMQSLQQEHLRVLLLDTRNRLLRECDVYVGSLNKSRVRLGGGFREA